MRFKLSLLFAAVLATQTGFAQLTVTSSAQSGNWADYYVNNVLLGAGVTAFNIQFSTDSMQIGEFQSVNTSVDIPYGVMISNGNVELAPGPNMSSGSTGVSGGTSDPDLVVLSGVSIHDAAILEFDFVPQGDSISFKYVFASEEYNEYVGGGVNDAFGFFLSGPGISGTYTNNAVNLAIIPGSGSQVSINTVNLGSNSAYYVNNDTIGIGTLEYDGLTVTLKAEYPVNCGDTYHIKLAVGDGGDAILDSGVFLEGGSFKANIVQVNITSVNGDSTINEGCGSASIRFSRSDTTDTTWTGLEYVGTATNGVDFTLMPDSILLLPGMDDTVVTIFPFFDGIAEGVEYITVRALSINICGDTFVSEGTLWFYDIPDLHLQTTEDTVLTGCPVDSLTLSCEVLSGGPPPYSYVWSTGHTTGTIQIPLSPIPGIDTFYVTVTDSCALFSVMDTVVVVRDFSGSPDVDILSDTLVKCAGDVVQLKAHMLFGLSMIDYVWSTGDTTAVINLTVTGTQSIMVTVTDECGGYDVDTAYVGIEPAEDFAVSLPRAKPCPGFEFELEAATLGGTAPYLYSWKASNPIYGNDSVYHFTITGDTEIIVWVRDFCMRETSDTLRITPIKFDPLETTLNDLYIECPGTSFELAPTVDGGVEPFRYRWNTSDTIKNLETALDKSAEFTLTVTDYCENKDTVTAKVSVEQWTKLSLFINGKDEICYGDEMDFHVTGRGGAGRYVYETAWRNLPQPTESITDLDDGHYIFVGTQNNIYYFTVTDRCGTRFTDSALVVVDHCLFVPNVITPNGDKVNDALVINNIEAFGDARLRVYNRWGTKMLDEQPYRNDWEPSDLASGTYYYTLYSESFPEIRGDLTILTDKK